MSDLGIGLVEFSERGNSLVVGFLGSLGVTEAESVRQAVRSRLEDTQVQDVIFNMTRVNSLDSSGIGCLLAIQQGFPAIKFRMVRLRPHVRQLLSITGLLGRFRVQDPPEAARTSPEGADREYLSVAGKYALTESGVQDCQKRRIPIRDLRLYRGTTVLGFLWKTVDPRFLELFVRHGLLASVEVESSEFLDKRTELLRLIQVVLEGVCLRWFAVLMGRWLADRAEGVRVGLASLTLKRLELKLRERTPEAQWPLLSRLLKGIDDTVWTRNRDRGSSARPGPLEPLAALVARSIGQLDVTESIALNLMEFVQQAERAHFLNLAERDPLTRKSRGDIPTLLANPEFRERLIEKAKLQKEALVLSISFGETFLPGSDSNVTEITVRNKGTSNNKLRLASMVESGKTQTAADLASGNAFQVEDIAMLNLESLRETCRTLGIDITTNLHRDERLDETVATMRLTFRPS